MIRTIARFAAATGVAAVGFLGLGHVAGAQTVDTYPTPTTEAIATTTTDPGNVQGVNETQGTVAVAAVTSEDANLARTGTESGKVALLGLAALGTGGVCVAAAKRRTASDQR